MALLDHIHVVAVGTESRVNEHGTTSLLAHLLLLIVSLVGGRAQVLTRPLLLFVLQ